MKRILIASFILTASFFTLPDAHAINGHNTSKFEHQLNSAYKYPNQFSAAINWRLSNRHIDLHKQSRVLNKFGWHPSVIAVISNPQLFDHAVNQRRQSRRLQQNYARNDWGGKRNNRSNFNRRNRNICR